MHQEFAQQFYLRKQTLEVPSGRYLPKQYFRSEDLVPLAQELTKDEVQEVCLAFFLDSQNQLLGLIELARGGLDWVSWDGRTLFTTALLCGAKRIVMCHNHPSGIAKPSRQDVAGMKRLIPAAGLLGLELIDHIVVSNTQWVSMAEFGLLPPVIQLIKEADKRREEEHDHAALAAEGDAR